MSQSIRYARTRSTVSVDLRFLRLQPLASFICVMVLLPVTRCARADGGHIALRSTIGAYSVTLFTAPEPLVSGPSDLSLLVQDAATGEILDDVTASGTLEGVGMPIHLLLTHTAASNKLLLAATPTLPAPGSYTLVLRIERAATPPATLTAQLSVAPNHRRRTTLLFAIFLPLAAILLFLVNQQAKDRRRRHLPPALH